jgi:hypothetical protein
VRGRRKAIRGQVTPGGLRDGQPTLPTHGCQPRVSAGLPRISPQRAQRSQRRNAIMGTLGGFALPFGPPPATTPRSLRSASPYPPAKVRRRQSRRAPHARKEGFGSDPKPFLSGLCALCALCGETPDRTVGRQVPRESWLAPMPYLPLALRARPSRKSPTLTRWSLPLTPTRGPDSRSISWRSRSRPFRVH